MPTASITSLSDFNANAAMQEFGMDPLDQTPDAISVRFIFKRLQDEGLDAKTLRGRKNLVELTKEKIHQRIMMLEEYGENFGVEHGKHRYDALLSAIICDEQIQSANTQLQDQKGNITGYENDGFDPDLLELAQHYHDQALDIVTQPNLDISSVMPESLFLAHLNTLQSLNDIDIPFEDLELDELEDFIQHELPAIRNFSAIHTDIGKEVSNLAEDWAAEINRILDEFAPEPPKSPSHLRPV